MGPESLCVCVRGPLEAPKPNYLSGDFRLVFDSLVAFLLLRIQHHQGSSCHESDSMKCIGRAIWLLLVQLLFQVAKSSSAESDLEEAQAEGSSSKQQGSWSQWWSYDGISGPDYWNINKQWRLCSLGRKQSPIEVRTDRLVYDHLLGPLHLSWLPAGVTNYDDATLSKAKARKNQEKQEPIRLRLLNSGRGIEAWLEPGAGSLMARAPSSPGYSHQEQLILSRGPLSYAYKLFKIELHSAASSLTSAYGPLTAGPEGASPEAGLHQQQLLGVSSRSSEHLIDGRAFDGELQLHFYNKQLASSAAEAQQLANEDSRPNLFAAISVFLVLATPRHNHKHPSVQDPPPVSSTSPTSMDDLSSNTTIRSAIDFILDNLGAIQNGGDSIELQLARGQLESLVPNKDQYVTYQGSLNRPPCAETVDWILMNKALRVDRTKFEYLFEKLTTNQENVRPIKALHRRLLRTTINHSGLADGEPTAQEDPLRAEDLDSDNSVEFKQQPRRTGSGKRIHSSSCSNVPGISSNKQQQQQNCSKQELDGGGQSEGHLDDGKGRRGPAGSCSMKPNYAYQLRYRKQF